MKLRNFFISIFIFPSLANADCNIYGLEKDAPILCGNAKQGGFLYGESDWNVSGENVFYKDSVFTIGLPMDAKSNLKLTFKKDKITKVYNYKIADRVYKKQTISVDDKFITYSDDVQKRIDKENEKIWNARESKNSDFIGFMDFKYPFDKKYPVSGVYGSRRVFNGNPKEPHKGFDIAAPIGTPVHSIGDGKVILAINSYLAGNIVIVSHGFNIYSAYLHLSKIKALVGDIVTNNSVIGLVGATGRVSGPHLHLGLYFGQIAIDPEFVIK